MVSSDVDFLLQECGDQGIGVDVINDDCIEELAELVVLGGGLEPVTDENAFSDLRDCVDPFADLPQAFGAVVDGEHC